MMSLAVDVTDLGNLAVIGPAIAGCAVWFHHRCGPAAARRFLVPVLVPFAAAVALKLVFRQLDGAFPDTRYALSSGAPSGHMVLSTAVFGGLALMLWRRRQDRLAGAGLAAAVVTLAGIAVTRVTLLAHTPADVVLGFLLGGAGAAWMARGMTVLPAIPPRRAAELLALLLGLLLVMHLSGLRIDSAQFI